MICPPSGQRICCRTLMLAAFLCVYFALHGQSGYYVTQYTSKDGLPQNSIRGIVFDKNGFLWAATEGGIARFDGRRFRVMGSDDHPWLKNQRFTHALPCLDTSILFIDILNGMYLLSNNRFTTLQSPGVKNPNLIHIFGSLPDPWSVINDSFFLQENHRININKMLGGHIIPLDEKNVVLTSDRVVMLNMQTHQYRILIPSITGDDKFGGLQGTMLWIDANDQLWMVTNADDGFKPCELLDEGGKKWAGSFKEAILYSQFPDDELYVTAGQKLYKIIPGKSEGDYIIKMVLDKLPENCTVKEVAYRKAEDVLVLGTDSKGIYVYHQKQFNTIIGDDQQNKVKNSFYAQCLPDTETLVASNGLIADLKTLKRKGSLPLKVNNYILCEDGKGALFYALGMSIFHYQYQTGVSREIAVQEKFATHSIAKIADTIWIGTTLGVGQIRNDSVVWIHKTPYRGEKQGITCIEVDAEGNLWFGSYFQMYRLNRASRQLDSFPLLAEADNRVIHLIRDKLFIGTYGNGYYVFHKGHLSRMPDGRNHELANAHTFVEDKDGYLWISTNRGLYKTHMDAIEAYLADTTAQLDYYVYLEEDGIINPEFNGGCSPPHLWLPDGRLSLPSLEGFILFAPDQISHFFPKDTLLIETIEIDGTRYLPDAINTIPANHANISVYFAGAWWNRPYNQYIYYRVDETDKAYRRIGRDQSSLSIGHLTPGKHTFVIRRRSGFGPEDYRYSRFHFIVEKPWYARNWAWVVFGLGIALITWGISVLYTRSIRLRNIELQRKVNVQTKALLSTNSQLAENLRKLEESEVNLRKNIHVRDRLISIITHDILTPLRFIGQIARLGAEEKPEDPGMAKRALTDVQNAIHKLFHSTQNLLHWVSYQQEKFKTISILCSPFAIVEQLMEDFKEMSRFQGNTLINEVPEDDVILADPNVLTIVLHNLLSNAIKYTHQGRIVVRSGIEQNWYLLEVSDTGRGMTPAQLENIRKGTALQGDTTLDDVTAGNGIGLTLVADLMRTLNGRWEIESPERGGTRVRIFLSMDQPSNT